MKSARQGQTGDRLVDLLAEMGDGSDPTRGWRWNEECIVCRSPTSQPHYSSAGPVCDQCWRDREADLRHRFGRDWLPAYCCRCGVQTWRRPEKEGRTPVRWWCGPDYTCDEGRSIRQIREDFRRRHVNHVHANNPSGSSVANGNE